jgi:hypothetical protein
MYEFDNKTFEQAYIMINRYLAMGEDELALLTWQWVVMRSGRDLEKDLVYIHRRCGRALTDIIVSRPDMPLPRNLREMMERRGMMKDGITTTYLNDDDEEKN